MQINTFYTFIYTFCAEKHIFQHNGIMPVAWYETVVVYLPACSYPRHLAHLAVEVFDGTCSVLTEHQATDTVLRGVAATVVILHVVLRMIWVVDTRQTLIVVIVGDELAFLRKVGSLLGQHIAERIISETCDAACRMVHLSTAVTHVVSRGRYIALRVGDTDKTLYAVVFEPCRWKMFQRY